MLHVAVLKKDTFQVVYNDVYGPIGGIPQPNVVAPSRRNDFNLNHGFIKMGERFLPGRFLNSCVEHSFPVFLNRLSLSFHRGQRLVYGQRNG